MKIHDFSFMRLLPFKTDYQQTPGYQLSGKGMQDPMTPKKSAWLGLSRKRNMAIRGSIVGDADSNQSSAARAAQSPPVLPQVSTSGVNIVDSGVTIAASFPVP